MIIRLLPTYIYLFMEAQNALEYTKVKLLILNNFDYNDTYNYIYKYNE